MKSHALETWLDEHRDLGLELLRVYLGLALCAKGIAFVHHGHVLTEAVHAAQIGWGEGIIAHYVVLAHLCGGMLLAMGLLTRVAAAAQLPVLAGAIVFVHRREGLFTQAQTLEFALLVFFLLALFTAVGGGKLSLDHWLQRRPQRHHLRPV